MSHTHEKSELEKKFNYANGMTIAQCRRVCSFFFGDFLQRVDKDVRNLRFLIYIFDEIYDEIDEVTLTLSENVDLDHFKNFWCDTADGENWKVSIIKSEVVKTK